MNIARSYKKIFLNKVKAKKEENMLKFFSSLNFRKTPKFISSTNELSNFIVEMSFIQGESLVKKELNINTISQIGKLLREVHKIPIHNKIGIFDENMQIENSHNSFFDFLKDKIIKWEISLKKITNDKFIFNFINWTTVVIDKHKNEISKCKPIFCHGDFDLKNIIYLENKISGLVDWEHSGIFCIEWELRKLIFLFLDNPIFLKSFINGYGVNGKVINDKIKLISFIGLIDCLGHLVWCHKNKYFNEYKQTIVKMKKYNINYD